MNIYLTLDYELFLGANTGTPENCLIRPMEALCDAVEEYGVHFTLFVDAAYLLRLTQLMPNSKQLQHDYNLVSANIISLQKRGHDIQLHFHPQWLYSEWNDDSKEWQLDYTHYKLSDMDRAFAFESFSSAKALLESIIEKKVVAFRAGGYCLESFGDYIDLFRDNGILIDSSVVLGRYNLAGLHYYDYRQIKPKRQVYHFNASVREEIEDGVFSEYPLSFCKWNPFYYHFKMKPLKRTYSSTISYGDGSSIGHLERKNNQVNKRNKVMLFLSPNTATAGSSGSASVFMNEYYKYAVKHKWTDLVIIGHPKEETDCSIKNLKNFIGKVYKEASFKRISE